MTVVFKIARQVTKVNDADYTEDGEDCYDLQGQYQPDVHYFTRRDFLKGSNFTTEGFYRSQSVEEFGEVTNQAYYGWAIAMQQLMPNDSITQGMALIASYDYHLTYEDAVQARKALATRRDDLPDQTTKHTHDRVVMALGVVCPGDVFYMQ